MEAVRPLGYLDFNEGLIQAVQGCVSSPVRANILGARVTTFAIGGPLRAVVTVESVQELSAVIKLLACEGQSFLTLGNGSNLLIGDSGVNAWVIKLGSGMKQIERRGSRFEVFGAAPLMSFARKVSDEGFSGLEFAAGIPASLGGAVFMNAGAHGSEIGSRIHLVRGVMPDGTVREWMRDELPWAYRHSGLPSGAVVTSVVLDLVEGDRDAIARACSEHLAERKARQPLSLPSAGSVFKNPSPSRPAGMVLESLGLKGFSVGGASISEMHANWIVNPRKEASAKDVLALIETCRERARIGEGLELEPEVRVWR
jgi:UDP-N-acetylmuramate dehydrogenase